ncbi:MFS transporter [Rhodococcus triatomae]|uniref:Drug resistance transporter, EmrB/QacA subfamily n=1 Tax=Rhodococcus triatomae TaxID=300028 RepID=A0A1G8NJN6_9NOCA|nr:MFS transporter [Rhodococcus triatomae]QNG20021.1 MFS transporter [Rhodococcus triatomae]QNG24063.1 MFS transporter [Rhodococcus triatomae]SDI80444.1 drug resistance transporter, EmrB/QacA subfamily [Rhodococcus triatomae]
MTDIHEQERSSLPDLPPHTDGNHAKRWLVLAVLGIAQLMVVLDATIVNIALPAAQRSLEFGDADRQWIITAYALAFGSLLLLGGRLGDLFGRRKVFIVGLVGFAVASAVGGAAVNFEMLVAARAGQGVFGALLAPAALSLLSVTFTDPAERAKAFGIFGAIAGAGGALGLLLGGALTEWVDWRWTLFVNLIFAAVALAGAVALLSPQRSEHRPKLDIPGTVTVSISLFSIVFGFSKAESNGWSSSTTIAWLVTGAVFMALFVFLQTRVANPLLPLRVVLDRIRAGSYLAIFISGAGMFAVFLFLTFYMQLILDYSPIVNGVAFMPMVAGIVLSSTISTAVLLPRVGPRILLTSGMIIAAVGMALLAQIEVHSSYLPDILPGLIVMGLGMGTIFAPAMQGATSGVQPEDSGVASATVNTMQQVGGSIGTALLSTVAATASTNYLADRAPSPEAIAQAAVESYTTTFWWAAGIFAAGAVLVALVMRSGLLPAAAKGEPVLVH